MAKAWPDETIGIIKFSIGGSSVLAWKPDWSKKDADPVGQGRHGSLYKKLMEKVDQASKARDIGQMTLASSSTAWWTVAVMWSWLLKCVVALTTTLEEIGRR